MQNNNLQNLKSFSPIIYKKGRQSYLFAKQNNRLYRIVFSFSKPYFLLNLSTRPARDALVCLPV